MYHKRTIQIAVVDKHGNKLLNKNISSSLDVLKKELARMPRDTQYVIESSSVWEGVYNCMAHDLGLDVILSNPYKTRLIAESKKKTDKVDAFILADMLRGGYIASCYVPDFETIDNRKLARYRGTLVRNRTGLKNSIHGILLQAGFKGRGTPFSPGWLMRVRGINDYRIHGYLRNIDAVNDLIAQADVRIADAVKASPNAMLLKTIPGVGNYSALIISSEIGDIARFHRPEKLRIRGNRAVGEKLCRDSAAWPDNPARKQIAALDPHRMRPFPCAICKGFLHYRLLQPHRKEEGQGKGNDGCCLKDAACHAHSTHGEKRVCPTFRLESRPR